MSFSATRFAGMRGCRARYSRQVDRAIAIDGEVRALAERPEHRAALSQIVEEVRAEMLPKHSIKGEIFGARIANSHFALRR